MKDLEAGRSVSVKVSAFNARGRSEAMTMEVHTTSAQHHVTPGEAEPDVQPGALGRSWLLGSESTHITNVEQ